MPAQVLQRMMRHTDIKTTLEFYADVERAGEEAIWGTGAATKQESAIDSVNATL